MPNKLKSLPDVSMNFRPVGTGASDPRRLWMCGHKNTKGTKRGSLLWKCAECAKESK